MKRAESVAVIYLSLLVCLALGQGTEGRGALTHVTTYVEAGHWGPLGGGGGHLPSLELIMPYIIDIQLAFPPYFWKP